MTTKEQNANDSNSEVIIFNKVLDWQRDLLKNESQNKSQNESKNEIVKKLSELFVIYACFKALKSKLYSFSIDKKSELDSIPTEKPSTRKCMVAFSSIEKEYLKGLHKFLECRLNLEYRSQLEEINKDIDLFQEIKSLLLDIETYDPIYVRNNGTESNKIYVTAFSTTTGNAGIDTTSEIPTIQSADVAKYLPMLLSWHDDEEEKKTYLDIMAKLIFPNDVASITELYNKRFAKKDLENNDFSRFIERVMLTSTLSTQIKASLKDLALYHACVLYFFDSFALFERPQREDDLYHILKQAMGNALVVFKMNREPTAFNDCWGKNPQRKNSKNNKKVEQNCIDKWTDLSTRQNWASNLNSFFEPDFTKENNDFYKEKIEHLCSKFNEYCSLYQENGNSGAVNDAKSFWLQEEKELIKDLIRAYDDSKQQGQTEGRDSFDQAVNSFYAIDWQKIHDLMNFNNKTKNRYSKSDKNKNLLTELTNVLENITRQEQYQEDSEAPLLDKVREICLRVLSTNDEKLTHEERTNLLSFSERYQKEIGNSDLSKFLKQKVQKLRAGKYYDLPEALTSIILLSVLSEIKEESIISDSDKNEKNTESSSDSIYLKEAVLKITEPDDDLLENLERKWMLALSFFSMMYGPLLKELSELKVGNKPLFKVQIQKKGDESKNNNYLINFVDWCSTIKYKEGNCNWWNKKSSSSEKLSLNCTLDLTFITTKQGQIQQSTETKKLSNTFDWEFNNKGIGSDLFLGVSQLLGIKVVADFVNLKSKDEFTERDEPAKITDTDDKQEQKQDSVLHRTYFTYNFYGIKGEYHPLSLDNTETFTSEEDASPFITFAEPKSVDSDDGDLMALIKKAKEKQIYCKGESNLQNIQEYLRQFVFSYRKTLWEFLCGKLNWQQVKTCANDYEQLLKQCNDAFEEYEGRNDNSCSDFLNDLQQILFRILRIGIADETDKDIFQFKPVAIACPWHIEGLKSIALKNKRVIDFVRSIRAYESYESNEKAFTLKQESQVDDRINLASCNNKLFGQEGLIKLLQTPLSLELVLPQYQQDVKHNTHDVLYRTQHCQGYALYEQNKQGHKELQLSQISSEEINSIREQFIWLIENFKSNDNEFNILFWQCPNYNLPLELFCSCLQSDEKNKSDKLATSLESYHQVSFYVVCNDNKERQQLRLLYESRLRPFWVTNQDKNRQRVINNRFAMIVTSKKELESQFKDQKQFFDLCLCYDILSSKVSTNNSNNSQNQKPLEKDEVDDFLVRDESFFPAFYAYQLPEAPGKSQYFLIAPFYTSTLKQTLRAFNVLINNSTQSLFMPFISNKSNEKDVDNNLSKIMEFVHTYSTLVITCDRLLNRENLYPDSKYPVFCFKQEGSIKRNIRISAESNNIKAQVTNKLKYLLENDIGVTAADNLNEMQKNICNSAIKLSGSIVLKAYQHNYICSEMMGLVLTQFIMEQIINLNSCGNKTDQITFMVDEYVSYLGLNDGSVADILTVQIFDPDDDKPYKIRCFVAESKFYQHLQGSPVEHSKDQLNSTVISLAQNFSRQNENFGCQQKENEVPRSVYYDRVVFRQRLAELFFEKIYKPEKKDFGKNIQKLVDGNFEVEIYAISCCFGYNSNANVDNISFKNLKTPLFYSGIKNKQAQLIVDGKDSIKELLKIFNEYYNNNNNTECAKKFFKSLRNLLLSKNNATPMTEEDVDRAFNSFGLAPLT